MPPHPARYDRPCMSDGIAFGLGSSRPSLGVPVVMTNDDARETDVTATNGATRIESTKPITIMLPDDLLKKLKIVAIVRETSVGELLAEAAAGVVRKELKKALSKISGE